MAGESSRLERAQAAARLLDDEALAALANKGLLRRARKDVETAPPKLVQGSDVRFQVEDATVTIAEMPTQSKCTCPASGICRHVLAAILVLRDSAVAASLEAAPVVAGAEVLALTDEDLRNAGGAALLRKATQALAMSLPVEFEEAATLRIRFPTWNVTCSWLPGGGVGGMICSCHAPLCEHRIAAVLAYQVSKGQRQLDAEAAVLDESAGAPRTRQEVVSSVGVVLHEMVSLGLARLSASTEDRLRTLAVSAHGVDLPRLERMLRSLADEVSLSLQRNAQAASANLLSTAANTEALRVALKQPSPGLVGVHRSRYEKVGDIELIGLGARQWRTRSGYIGLTIYFWDRSMKDWATWSESRPVSVPDFNPADRYRQDGLWGLTSPAQTSRSAVRLMGTWRNRSGRLSGRPSMRSLLLGPTDVNQVPCAVTQWSALGDRANRLFAAGLTERREQDEIVLLRPKNWDTAVFDPIGQELMQTIHDESGRPLLVTMPHTPMTENAISILERHDPRGTWGLLGLLRLRHGQLAVEPVTLFGDTIVHLTLDGNPPNRSTAASPVAAAVEVEELEDSDDEPEEVQSTSPLGHLFTQAAELLEAMAEGGLRSARNVDQLRHLSARCDSLGLTAVARPLGRLADQLDRLRKTTDASAASAAETLLRTRYLLKFAAAQEAVAAAIGSLNV
jgi:SWIM zinc finger